MLGALSKCLANINSYRPQEMSKYKPGFPRVGKKGRDQIQQQNRELRVRGVTVTQRGALGRWWPCMLDAVCTQVRLRVIPRDPGDEEGVWAEQHQGYGDLASVGLPAAIFSPHGRMFISPPRPSPPFTACTRRGISPALQGGWGLLLQALLSRSQLPGTEGDDECWTPTGTWLVCPRCAKPLALWRKQGFLPVGMHVCLVEVFQGGIQILHTAYIRHASHSREHL